jgi:predicted Rossmann fold nucleotide-binding protein DprA/Smf involved in DNA uptake
MSNDFYTPPADFGPLFAAARRSDPPTSHAAARRAPVRGHCRLILDSFGQGPAGQTEIARRTGLTVAAVSKRLPELRRAGLVEATGREVAAGEAEYRAMMEAMNGR